MRLNAKYKIKYVFLFVWNNDFITYLKTERLCYF